ncbi:MAG: fumarylacetoacetate hydrolase family protein [bacterium]|nr:fumarylacetoacetate hydrolase family protein [bacterium]
MFLYRTGPEGFFAATDPDGELRTLYSDPFDGRPSAWELGRRVDLATTPLLAPFHPGKIVGVGRNYPEHARELGNPLPAEPVLFLKAPSSVIGPTTPIVLPPESERVEYEGEIAVVLQHTLRRASETQARAAILGVTCACDVTARDLQRRDPTFARAKSFDTFCPLGPAVRLKPELDQLEVLTRINGEERQRGKSGEMSFAIVDLLVYASRMMTLEPGDVVLTGTPSGVGTLSDGDRVEVEISGVGILENPVESWRKD